MKRNSTLFLQVVIVALGLGTLTLLLWLPHLEGRNVDATPFEIYFNDPFLLYVYIASIAFFVAIYKAFLLLTYIKHNEIFSQQAVRALRAIKYCALSLVVFMLGAEIYFFLAMRGKDDIAGGVMVGLCIMLISIVVATAAAVFEKTLQSAVDIKSENDLTV